MTDGKHYVADWSLKEPNCPVMWTGIPRRQIQHGNCHAEKSVSPPGFSPSPWAFRFKPQSLSAFQFTKHLAHNYPMWSTQQHCKVDRMRFITFICNLGKFKLLGVNIQGEVERKGFALTFHSFKARALLASLPLTTKALSTLSISESVAFGD